MSDDKEYSEEEEEEEEEAPPQEKPAKVSEEPKDEPKPEISEAELALEKMRKKKEEEEAFWTEYLEQRKKQRLKEEEDLKKLKERQMKRREKRKEEEKRLLAYKKQQEAQRIKEMEEKKAREAEAKKRRLEEAEKKRQAMQQALQRTKEDEPVTPNFVITKRADDGSIHPVLEKFPSALYMRTELAKTKEQLAEDKKIALQLRVKPLQIEGLNIQELRQKAQTMWEAVVRLEMEKYDLEERKKRQEYDLKELSERQRQINRSKALKKGLDPEALSGKYPPKVNVASKYERRLDRRSFTDKRSLFEGGYMSELEQKVSTEWESKIKNFKDHHGPSKLPKWDPAAAKNKEKPEIQGTIEDEDSEDDAYLGGPPPGGEQDMEPSESGKTEEREEEEEEEEEEGEEEEEEEEE